MAVKNPAGATRGQAQPKEAAKRKPVLAGEFIDPVTAGGTHPNADRVSLIDTIFPKGLGRTVIYDANGATLVDESGPVRHEVRIEFAERQTGLSAALTAAFHAGKLKALAANG